MKKGWEYKKLGEVCETLNGLWKGKKPPFVKVGVIRNANFAKDFSLRFDNIEYLEVEEKQFQKRKLLKGDLIVEKSGGSDKQPVGRAVLFDKDEGEFSFSNFTSVLRIKEKKSLLSKFLFLYLLFIYKRGDTRSMQRATTGIHNVEFDKYLAIPIPLPPLSEQQRIVAKLDAAFAQIDKMKANAEKQLIEARALFQRALSQEMQPKEGWEEKTLGEVAEYSIGLTYKPKDVNEKGTIVLRSSNIQDDKIDLSDIVRVNCPIKESLYVKEGDILMCSRNGSARLVGKVAVIPEIKEKMTYGTFMMIIRSKRNPYLFYFFKSKDFRNQIKHGEANMINQITRYMLDDIVVSLPPLSEQQRIVTRLDALSENVRKYEEAQRQIIAECDALKQSMLREIFES